MAPPLAEEAERQVLGSVLVSDVAMARATMEAGLLPGHFYSDRNRKLFEAFQALTAEGRPVDEITVAAKHPADRGYLGELASSVKAPGNVKHYADDVIQAANLRTKLTGAQEIIRGVGELDQDVIQAGLELASMDLEVESQPTSPEEIAAEFMEWVSEEVIAPVFDLPWSELNKFCGDGYGRGEVAILCGWTWQGKSLVLDQMLTHWARQNHRCFLLTTEMQRRDRVARYLTGETGIPYVRIKRRDLSSKEKEMCGREMKRFPYHHIDADGWTADRICQAIVHKRPDVAAIDPVNLIPRRDTFDADETARKLLQVARRTNCLLIVASHLNLKRATDAVRPRPVLRDIRDTGMLAANAAQVLSIWREQDQEGNPQAGGELAVLKGRDGFPGKVRVELDPRRLRFRTNGEQGALDADPGPDRQETMYTDDDIPF